MSVWREVKERLYLQWATEYGSTTSFAFANEQFDPQGAEWVRVRVQQRPGGQETLGRPGTRRMDRQGVIFASFMVPPGSGDGRLSDLAAIGGQVFEGRRLDPHDIRLGAAQIGLAGEIDGGTWWGVTTEVPFAYQDVI